MNPQAALLDQLNDITLPSAIDELAWGWVVLWGLILIAVVALVMWLWHVIRSQKDKRIAKAQLKKARAAFLQDQDKQRLCQQVNAILKGVCKQRYPEALALSGQPWIDFLNRKRPLFEHNSARAMAQGIYQASVDYSPESLLNAALRWIRSA